MDRVTHPAIMRAVEKLGYRVTIGDVASQSGLEIKLAEQGLLALASEAGGHLQVAESGEIAYLFPRNFRDILRNKYWRLGMQERLGKIWNFVFYLIRISFGLYLLASIAIIFVAIIVIMIALNSRDGEGGNSDVGGDWLSSGGLGGNWFFFFTPDYYSQRSYRQRSVTSKRNSRSGADSDSSMNFLEAIFSFLFGDGDPNADLEERRWQTIGTVIRNNGGAIIAEQIAPYLDQLGRPSQQEYEDYMLPVLSRFNGRPEVSPTGQLVYHFPELQVSAQQTKSRSVAAYLKELPWRFSRAGSGQIAAAISLGVFNLVGALVLGGLLANGADQIGSDFIGFVASIYGLLLGYGSGFLGIPLVRYFWLQGRNRQVDTRNQQRESRAVALNRADQTVQQKLDFARQFVKESVVDESDLAYTTQQDLTEQEIRQAQKIDAEWEQRLEGRN